MYIYKYICRILSPDGSARTTWDCSDSPLPSTTVKDYEAAKDCATFCRFGGLYRYGGANGVGANEADKPKPHLPNHPFPVGRPFTDWVAPFPLTCMSLPRSFFP